MLYETAIRRFNHDYIGAVAEIHRLREVAQGLAAQVTAGTSVEVKD